MTQIRFESENYYFQLYNLDLKPEFRSPEAILQPVKALEDLTGFKVIRIFEKEENGRPINLYTAGRGPLPPDTAWMTLGIYKLNDLFWERLLYVGGKRPRKTEALETMARFFTWRGSPITAIFQCHMISGEDWRIKKLRKTAAGQSRPVLHHQQMEASPIEEKFQKALADAGISFTKQQEVFAEGALLAVPDFLIEKPLIAIFCDGFQFHSGKMAVLKDRKQDRVLQAMGYIVLRFTGSEIVGHEKECVDEVRRFIGKAGDA